MRGIGDAVIEMTGTGIETEIGTTRTGLRKAEKEIAIGKRGTRVVEEGTVTGIRIGKREIAIDETGGLTRTTDQEMEKIVGDLEEIQGGIGMRSGRVTESLIGRSESIVLVKLLTGRRK